MGIISNILGIGGAAGQIGGAVGRVAEVFVPNKTKDMTLQHEEFTAALSQFGGEFKQQQTGFFNRFVNGLNRLPRPVLALGTVALFVYAMWDPVGFTARMQGLGYVPEPLWWLLGAVVSFYFGARELHYLRGGRRMIQAMPSPDAAARAKTSSVAAATPQASGQPASGQPADGNAALDDWRRSRTNSG